MTQALERDGTDPDAWFLRGIALEAAGQVEASIDVARGFLEAVELGFYPRDDIATYCPFFAALRGIPSLENTVPRMYVEPMWKQA